MDGETRAYIINHFSFLFTKNERLAQSHHLLMAKAQLSGGDLGAKRVELFKKTGWLSDREEALSLLANGYDAFLTRTAERILLETPEKVFINKCPECGKLARTPYARQCRYCKHDWHDKVVAKFEFVGAFQITGRNFHISGIIRKGEIEVGNLVEFKINGFTYTPKIESIGGDEDIPRTSRVG